MLVGRDREVAAVVDHLRGRGTVLLAGPPGIGKSSLAVGALERLGSWRASGALATLRWQPLLLVRRLAPSLRSERPEDVAGAILRSGSDPLLLDDVQWADDASLEVASRLMGQVPIVATLRTGEERSELVAEVLTMFGAVRLEVEPLAPEAAAELAYALHPDLAPAQVDELVASAAGNPLLLSELPLGATDSPSLVTVLRERVGALTPAGRTAMERLSVLGRPASPVVLGAGAGELQPAGLAVPDGDLIAVRHGLLGELVVEQLAGRAEAIRRELAEVVDAAQAAHLLAEVGEHERARALALQAVASASQREAVELLVLAVRCASDLDPEHRVRAARLATSTDQPALARSLCAVDGRDSLPPLWRGALLATEAEAAWSEGHQQECLDLLDRALLDLRGTRTAFEVLALAGSTLRETSVTFDGASALPRARKALALAEELGQELAFARTRLAAVLQLTDEPGWEELFLQVMHQAAIDGDDDAHRTASVGLFTALWTTGHAPRAEALAREELARGPAAEFDASWLTVAAYAAVLGLVTGRDRAELVDEFGPILRDVPYFSHRPFLEVAVVLALADLGRTADARDLVAGAVERAGHEPQWRVLALWAVVESHWLAGRLHEAVAAVDDLLALGVGDHPAAVAGRLAAAHASRELGRPLVGPPTGAPRPAWAAAPLEWAALEAAAEGRRDEAVAGLLAAAEAWGHNDVRSVARCCWAAGELASEAGRADAAELLEEAEAAAEAHGLVAMASRARRSLRSSGRERRSPITSGLGTLSGREVEVLDLVADGLDTGAIATALGIAATTVESHLRGAMRKLHVPTRVAAVARLGELRSDGPATGGT